MYLIWDGFESMTTGHGGNHRSAQVSESCRATGLDARSVAESAWTWRSMLRSVIRMPGLLLHLPSVCWKSPKDWLRLLRLNAIIEHNEVTVIICEKCYWSPWIVAFASRMPMCCIPHNIESMVPGQVNNLRHHDPQDVAAELALLSRMDACFCICPEDAAIVRAVHKDVHVLPYFPHREFYEQLLEIRVQREKRNCNSGHILILGSVGNGPTMLGTVELLRALRDRDITFTQSMVVAGFGTEKLQDEFGSVCSIRGSVTQDELRDLMINAKCIVANHTATTGCLTRVVDALIAGVPVLANRYALRGNAHLHGIVAYDKPEHAFSICQSTQLEIPSIPKRPTEEEQAFISRING